MDNLPRFYRVLYTAENKSAWKTKQYYCGHVQPHDWFTIWKSSNGSLNPADYPARCSEGYYSDNARSTFLQAVKEDRVNAMTADEAKQICEQAGVCAYPTPTGAFNYLCPESPARRQGTDGYVEFGGEKLADDNVERDGAVIARVIETDGRMLCRAEFARVHNLQDK